MKKGLSIVLSSVSTIEPTSDKFSSLFFRFEAVDGTIERDNRWMEARGRLLDKCRWKGNGERRGEGFFRDGCSFAIMDGGNSGALCLVDIATPRAFFILSFQINKISWTLDLLSDWKISWQKKKRKNQESISSKINRNLLIEFSFSILYV